MYIAIIGDIISSRELPDREQVQETFNTAMHQINLNYHDEIASGFLVTLGDEFQGLLKSGGHVLDIIYAIERMMGDVPMRFGIGLGDLDTRLHRDRALGADGPAYHRARKAVDELKAREESRESRVSNIMISGEEDPAMLNCLLNLMKCMENRWSTMQKKVVLDYLRYRDRREDAARRLAKKQPNISRDFNNANGAAYVEAYDLIQSTLRKEIS